MARVWRRPGLTALEVLWRWTFCVATLGLAAWFWGARALRSFQELGLDRGWDAPGSVELWLRARGVGRLYGVTFHGAVVAVVVCLAWAVVSAPGRSLVLQRLAPRLRKNLGSLVVISLLRVLCLVGVWVVWFACVSAAADRMVVMRFFARQEPGYVPFAAVLIFGTLALFVLWMAASYVFHLAPVLSMAHGLSPWRSLGEAFRGGPLRGKLMEINLVMGIVKIALLVLAMVFSACPLPFSSVETQAFLMWWWAGVGVWYLLASDYFHVVRIAATLALWQAHEPTSGRETAS